MLHQLLQVVENVDISSSSVDSSNLHTEEDSSEIESNSVDQNELDVINNQIILKTDPYITNMQKIS